MVTSYRGHTIRSVFGGATPKHIVDDDKEFATMMQAMLYVDKL